MDKHNRSPVRVLIRPPPPPSSSTAGVVVVGFIAKHSCYVTHLINRVIDSNVFGSGNRDRVFGDVEEIKELFKEMRISYYHDCVKGLLYLQFSLGGEFGGVDGFDEEEREFRDLQGMLFMFSVCHVIIFLQDGSHFDIQNLKKFRVLQAAKHAMSPFVTSLTSPPVTSRSQPSFSSRASATGTSSKNRSPGKSGPIMNRNGSAVTIMSGLGSYTSLFPGQCTPVTLFVFVDDYSEFNAGSTLEEPAETSQSNHSSTLSSLARPILPQKGPGTVVMLSRPISKSENGLRKKLQSSLEAQIRFSIKKCRTLAGFETSHTSRNSGVATSAPLFSFDATKAVALVDRRSILGGESLEFATSIVENVLNGTSTSDSFLLESHSQSANKEDILAVKDFIFRQSDVLRGRGGTVSSANSVSAAGVGMVAVAAAAAAASVAPGKSFNAPELPSLEVWLSSSLHILHGLLSAKRKSIDEPEIRVRKPLLQNNLPPAVEGNGWKVTDSLEVAISHLDSGRRLNTKFSTLWCQRALPVAKQVYLNDLPSCYPTSKHNAHLDKALFTFKSMVKGPAVQLYVKKLENECTFIWKSGRQLCDAVSLTGKSCIYQRHDLDGGAFVSSGETKSHSSGYVFLHACACGRSRRLRSDPFDFESANSNSCCYPDCDKALPAIKLPQGNSTGPIDSSSWSLVRLGASKYYQPSKGLLQGGFITKEKFLLKMKIFIGRQQNPSTSTNSLQVYSLNGLSNKPMVQPAADANEKKTVGVQLSPGEKLNGAESHKKSFTQTLRSDNISTNLGKGHPNFTMRKPFSEVVAGSVGTNFGFPPLQSKKQPLPGSGKVLNQNDTGDTGTQMANDVIDHVSKKVGGISGVCETEDGDRNVNVNSFIHPGSNAVPLTMNSHENIKLCTSLKHVTAYVGFEHECPSGHRFILTPEHLTELGTAYALNDESLHSSINAERKMEDPSKPCKNGGHGKVHRHSNRMASPSGSKLRNSGKSKLGSNSVDGFMTLSGSSKEQNGLSTYGNSLKQIEGSLQSISLDDGGRAFSLLNRRLPVYLNCPHCRNDKKLTDSSDVKFAGTISQLMRIYLVTPPFPVVLSTNPVIQFEASCLPPSVLERERKLRFSLVCPVVLPPESFLSLKLPFVYGVRLEDASSCPLKPFENQPELTAWIEKSTALQIVSEGINLDEMFLK